MARIETYVSDQVINNEDKIIGTDGAIGANNATKNFTVGTLKEFINTGVPEPTDPTDTVNQGYVADNVVNSGSISGTTLTLTRTGELADVTITGVGQVQSLTTTGDSGAATLVGGTLNIPQYSGGGGGIGGDGTETQIAIFSAASTITSTQAVAVNSSSQIIMEVLRSSNSYADDTAALAGGVPYGGLYRTGSTVKINLLESASSPGSSADVCGIEFTTTNTTITAVTSGPDIVIATDVSDWNLKISQGVPAAAYYNYDIANAERGLYYNIYAFAVIQPPTGFRKPDVYDITTLINSPCSDTSLSPANRNSLATSVGTGGWNESLFTNTTNRGNSGLDLRGYGYYGNTGNFDENQSQGGFWYAGINNVNFSMIVGDTDSSAYMTDFAYQLPANTGTGFNIRFCKDIP